jgi:hypothetical protein
MKAHMTTSLISPLIGFALAGLGVGMNRVAAAVEAIPPETTKWMEFGGSMGIVAGLSYAVLTLWKELNKQRDKFDQLNQDVRGEWKAQSEKLTSVLEKLDTERK